MGIVIGPLKSMNAKERRSEWLVMLALRYSLSVMKGKNDYLTNRSAIEKETSMYNEYKERYRSAA